MKIAAMYSVNGGHDFVNGRCPHLLAEVSHLVEATEVVTPGMDRRLTTQLSTKGWKAIEIAVQYTVPYTADHQPVASNLKIVRVLDYAKERLGLVMHFGKAQFDVYSTCAQMTIFHNLGFIDAGIEIVPIKDFADDMSTGVSYFEQFVWDLQQRGISNIDIPVLILGIKA